MNNIDKHAEIYKLYKELYAAKQRIEDHFVQQLCEVVEPDFKIAFERGTKWEDAMELVDTLYEYKAKAKEAL